MKDKCFIPMSYLFLEINKMFINNVKIELEKIGINPTYRYIFHYLIENPNGVSQRQICEHVHMKAPSISLTLQQMESEELIIREKSNTDSRTIIVKLTEKGKKLDLKLRQIFKKHEDNMVNSLTQDELNNLLIYIEKIKTSLKGDE